MKKAQQQSSLDSFFGAQSAKPKKEGPQQKKLNAFFGSSKVPSTKEPKASTPISPTDISSASLSNCQAEIIVEASPNDRLPSSQSDAVNATSPLKNTEDKLQKEENDIDHYDDSMEEEEDVPVVNAKRRIASSQIKRRVIEDSDDDSVNGHPEDPPEPLPDAVEPTEIAEPHSKRTKKTKLSASSPKPISKEAPNDAIEAKEETIPDETTTAEPSTASEVAVTKKSDAIKASKSSVAKTTKNGENGKCSYPSDEELLRSLPTSDHPWLDNEPIPYYMVCQTFHEIEQITSRLQIQEIMTSLIRRVLLKHSATATDPTVISVQQRDLQALLYLASNTVAPAYECVELGIGDALLIKAIGQATGTNPAMVKQKYETLGDLGMVAQSYKSKQSTLGGFFAKAGTTPKTAKKTYLTAQEVWLSFQQIAQTKGNHSQQWKVDIIKKMLVRTIDPMETKYIIRGLQGKLRIGLAQSTVLIAFAHAFTLTRPISVASNVPDSDVSDDKLTNGTSVDLHVLVHNASTILRVFFVSCAYPLR
jgi:DNA ligase N terminus